MQKSVIVLISCFLFTSLFATGLSINNTLTHEHYPSMIRKDSLKTDEVFNFKKMGYEIKMTLNKSGEIGFVVNENQIITIDSDGSVGFGTKNPEYKLDVCGSIRASEELIVEANEWCDFVFEKEYSVQPFKERMTAIKTQKHLPYIQAQESIINSGIPVSETISGLLRNVEELYLYIEDLERRINMLEEENKELNSLLNEN